MSRALVQDRTASRVAFVFFCLGAAAAFVLGVQVDDSGRDAGQVTRTTHSSLAADGSTGDTTVDVTRTQSPPSTTALDRAATDEVLALLRVVAGLGAAFLLAGLVQRALLGRYGGWRAAGVGVDEIPDAQERAEELVERTGRAAAARADPPPEASSDAAAVDGPVDTPGVGPVPGVGAARSTEGAADAPASVRQVHYDWGIASSDLPRVELGNPAAVLLAVQEALRNVARSSEQLNADEILPILQRRGVLDEALVDAIRYLQDTTEEALGAERIPPSWKRAIPAAAQSLLQTLSSRSRQAPMIWERFALETLDQAAMSVGARLHAPPRTGRDEGFDRLYVTKNNGQLALEMRYSLRNDKLADVDARLRRQALEYPEVTLGLVFAGVPSSRSAPFLTRLAEHVGRTVHLMYWDQESNVAGAVLQRWLDEADRIAALANNGER